jgi:hypothetical protein
MAGLERTGLKTTTLLLLDYLIFLMPFECHDAAYMILFLSLDFNIISNF